MNLKDRLEAFEKLGKYIHAIDEAEFNDLIERAKNENSWFTPENIRLAVKGLAKYLDPQNLARWVAPYDLSGKSPKVVAVVMAGNIPLVGFHDFLSVLISGNVIQIKPSSKDTVLLRFILNKLTAIEPQFASRILLVDQLKNFDAVIATGSDNTSRYFEYYFSKYPHIIRRNRTSCAILSGYESESELNELGKDVFTYFGLGCRNVSKVFVPEQYDFPELLRNLQSYEKVMMHHKYHNNYDYQKSILLVNKSHFLDSGFLLLQESDKLVSPISVLYYEYYKDWESLKLKLESEKDKLQCIVGNVKPATVRIGQAQYPELWDYADQIDTLRFLKDLN